MHTICAAIVRCLLTVRNRAGRVLASTPATTCGLVTRPPGVKRAKAKLPARFWIWWRGWKAARFGRRHCDYKGGGVGQPVTRCPINWFQNEGVPIQSLAEARTMSVNIEPSHLLNHL